MRVELLYVFSFPCGICRSASLPSYTLVLTSCSRAVTQFVLDGIDEKLRAKQNSLFVLIFAFAMGLYLWLYVLDVNKYTYICMRVYFLNCCPASGSVASLDMMSAMAIRERVDIEINIGDNLQRLNLFLGIPVENGCGISRMCKLKKRK